jgi:hypothetical protein
MPAAKKLLADYDIAKLTELAGKSLPEFYQKVLAHKESAAPAAAPGADLIS